MPDWRACLFLLTGFVTCPTWSHAQVVEILGEGDEAPVAIGPGFQPNLTTESERITVGGEGPIREADSSAVCFDINAPGLFQAGSSNFPDGSCPFGFAGAMNATLIHYNFPGTDVGSASAVVVMEQPIVGLSVTRASLLATDDIVDPAGLAGYSDDDFRGLEGASGKIDTLELGANRHVVAVDLHTSTRFDNVRIFTRRVSGAADLTSCPRSMRSETSVGFTVEAFGPAGEPATLLTRFPDQGTCRASDTPCDQLSGSLGQQLASCSLGTFEDASPLLGTVTCSWTGDDPTLTLLGGEKAIDLGVCLTGAILEPPDAGADGGTPSADAGSSGSPQFAGGAACAATHDAARQDCGAPLSVPLVVVALCLWRRRRLSILSSQTHRTGAQGGLAG